MTMEAGCDISGKVSVEITELQTLDRELTTADGTPILPAIPSADGVTLRVWCKYCGCWHTHGAATGGHRVAHCVNLDSPYLRTGYYLAVDEGAR